MTAKRINIGCGETPTPGWCNFDNSPSVRLARWPAVPAILWRLGLIEGEQYHFARFARAHGIEYGDATRGLPVPSGHCEVVYSSHMLEHLDRTGADRFCREVLRVLAPGGIVRIAIPDLAHHTRRYAEHGDADAFLGAIHVCAPQPRSLVKRLRAALVGPRHHLWMYDGASLGRLLGRHGFADIRVVPAGTTTIPDPGPLDLCERAVETAYVEAKKP